MAKASAAEAAVAARKNIQHDAARATIRQLTARVLDATANPDGPGLLVRGSEYAPLLRSDLDRPRDAEIEEVPPSPREERGARGVRCELRGASGLPVDIGPFVVDALVRMARVAAAVGDALRDCPDPNVRRSAAILAARAHPLRAAFDA